jgi:CHAD domain-containing protein
VKTRVSTRLLEERVRAFFRHVPRALAGDAVAVHEMRVAGRRLRAVLPLLARKPNGRRLRRARRGLKHVIRAMAPARDLDVSLSLFEAQARSRPASPEALYVRRRLRAARGRSRARVAESRLEHRLAGLRRALRAILARGGAKRSLVQVRMRRAGGATGEELLARAAALGNGFDPDELHELRRRIRRLRYLAEVAARVDTETSDAPEQLKRLQDGLGRIHDAWILEIWLERASAAADARGEADLSGGLRRLGTRLRAAARAHHRAYLKQDPGSILERAVDGIAPDGARRAPEAP